MPGIGLMPRCNRVAVLFQTGGRRLRPDLRPECPRPDCQSTRTFFWGRIDRHHWKTCESMVDLIGARKPDASEGGRPITRAKLFMDIAWSCEMDAEIHGNAVEFGADFANARLSISIQFGIKSAFVRVADLSKMLGIPSNSIHALIRQRRFPIPHPRPRPPCRDHAQASPWSAG